MANRPKDFSTTATVPASDDYLILDGSSNSTRKILASYIDNGRNTLAPRGGVYNDGTSGARIYSTLTNQALGTDSFSIVCVFRVPSSSAAFNGPFMLSTVTSTPEVARGFYCDFASNGNDLRIILLGATTDDAVVATVSGWRTTWAGKVVCLTLVRNSSTPSFTIYTNGVATTYTETTGGASPTWAGTVASTVFVVAHRGNQGFTGAVYSASLYNLALSAADVLEIYELGGAVPERYKFGSQSDINTSAFVTGDYSQTYDTFSGASASGFTAVQTAGSGTQRASSRPTLTAAQVIRGGQVRVKYSATLTSGQAPTLAIVESSGSLLSGLTTVLAGANSVTIPITGAPNSANRICFTTNAPSSYAISGIEIETLGAVVHLPLNDGAGLIARDESTNALHAALTTTGVSHTIASNGPLHVRRSSSTNGNEQLFGQVCIPANAQIMRVRAKARTNTPTVTLGTASGGAQVVASVALTTAWKDLTLALTGGMVGASNISLWAGSNSTDVVDWDVAWEPLST